MTLSTQQTAQDFYRRSLLDIGPCDPGRLVTTIPCPVHIGETPLECVAFAEFGRDLILGLFALQQMRAHGEPETLESLARNLVKALRISVTGTATDITDDFVLPCVTPCAAVRLQGTDDEIATQAITQLNSRDQHLTQCKQ